MRASSTANFIAQEGKIGEIPYYATTFLSTTEQAILADWSTVALVCWGSGLEFIVDPFSLASSGEIVVTALIYYNVFARRPQTVVISTDSGAQ